MTESEHRALIRAETLGCGFLLLAIVAGAFAYVDLRQRDKEVFQELTRQEAGRLDQLTARLDQLEGRAPAETAGTAAAEGARLEQQLSEVRVILEERIAGLETRLTELADQQRQALDQLAAFGEAAPAGEDMLDVAALERLEARLRAELEARAMAAAETERELRQLLDRLGQRLETLETQVGAVEETVEGGFWQTAERFLAYAEDGFQGISGESVSHRRQGWTAQARVSRILFQDRWPTLIWQGTGGIWCEVTYSLDELESGTTEAFLQLRETIARTLPLGWRMETARNPEYRSLERVISPEGDVFRIAVLELMEKGDRVYRTVLEFPAG